MDASSHDIAGLFKIWGALGDFAQSAGISYGAAKQMRRRGSIPVEYWASLICSDRGKALGLSADHLLRMHSAAEASPDPTPAEVAA